MLDCTIVGISQDMDLEQNITVTYLSLRLSTGQVLRAAVDDEAASVVVDMQVRSRGMPRAAAVASAHPAPVRPPPVPPAQPPQAEELEEYDTAPPGPSELTPIGDGISIFGGQDTTEEEAKGIAEGSPTFVADAAPPEPEKPKKPQRSNVQTLANGKVIVPSTTVPSRLGGYPIAKGGADPSEFTGTRNPDEDGVGSV